MESKWCDRSFLQENHGAARTSAFTQIFVSKTPGTHIHRPTSFRIDDLIVANKQTSCKQKRQSMSPPILVATATPTSPLASSKDAYTTHKQNGKLSSSSSNSPPEDHSSEIAPQNVAVSGAIELQRQLLVHLTTSSPHLLSNITRVPPTVLTNLSSSSSTDSSAAALLAYSAAHLQHHSVVGGSTKVEGILQQSMNCLRTTDSLPPNNKNSSFLDDGNKATQRQHPLMSALWPLAAPCVGDITNAVLLQQYASFFSASLAAASSITGEFTSWTHIIVDSLCHREY